MLVRVPLNYYILLALLIQEVDNDINVKLLRLKTKKVKKLIASQSTRSQPTRSQNVTRPERAIEISQALPFSVKPLSLNTRIGGY